MSVGALLQSNVVDDLHDRLNFRCLAQWMNKSRRNGHPPYRFAGELTPLTAQMAILRSG
jgi:hypothetical protein